MLSEYHRARLEDSQEKGNREPTIRALVKRMAVCLEGHLDTGQSPSRKALCPRVHSVPGRAMSRIAVASMYSACFKALGSPQTLKDANGGVTGTGHSHDSD